MSDDETTDTDEDAPIDQRVTAFVRGGGSEEYRAAAVARLVEEHPYVAGTEVEYDEQENPIVEVFECPEDDCETRVEIASFAHRTNLGYTASTVRCQKHEDAIALRRVD